MITLFFLALSLLSSFFSLDASYKDFENYLRNERFGRALTYCTCNSAAPQVQRFNRYLELILSKAAMRQFNLQYYKLHESNIFDLLSLEEFYYVTYGTWPHTRGLNKNTINKTEVIDYYNELFIMLERDLDHYYDQDALYQKSVEAALSMTGSKFQHFYRYHEHDYDTIYFKRAIERIALKIMAKWPQAYWLVFTKTDLYYILFGKTIIGDPGYSPWQRERLEKLYNEYHAKLQQKVVECSTSHNHPS